MQIRELTVDDIPAAASLWEQAGLTRPWNPPASDLQRALDGETSTVLGGFENECLLATVMVGNDGHRGWMYYLAVDKSRRRAGLGRQMVAAGEGWLQEHGAVKVQLMVRSTNYAVLGFYDHLGYEDADVRVRSKWLK